MDPTERKLRAFRAAFYVQPAFSNWVRRRAYELKGEEFEILVCWGRLRFCVRTAPRSEPHFAIRRADGSLERPPWVGR
jgi:hypothetical protein